MFDLSTLGTFVAVVLGLFLIPGPAVLLVLTRTVQGGRKVGILTGLGVATGDFIHTLCAAAGLSALLMTSALAFNAVKLIGAAYLIYLGVQALRQKSVTPGRLATVPGPVRPVVSADPTVSAIPLKASAAFFQAIPAEVLNPKTALFFLAFLPQFVHPEHGSSFQQFAVLGLIFVALGVLYTTFIVLAIRPLGRLVGQMTWLRRWQHKLIGILFISLGIKVATQSR